MGRKRADGENPGQAVSLVLPERGRSGSARAATNGRRKTEAQSLGADLPADPKGASSPSILLTHSEIETFRLCPKRWELSYRVLGTGVTPSLPAVHMGIGSAYHYCMEKILGGSEGDPSIWADAWVEAWKAWYSPEDQDSIRAHATGLARCHKAIVTGLEWKVLAIEKTFEVQLLPGIQLAGKVDGIVQREDGVWLLEHKTASRLDADYLSCIPRDAQVLRYTWALRETGTPIVGVIYTIGVKSALRGRANESHEALCMRVLEDYATKGREAIHHEVVRFGEEDIERCIQNTRRTARDMRLRMELDGPWTRHEIACRYKGGLCPYFRPCLQTVWDGTGEPPVGLRVKTAKHEELELD